MRLAGAGTVCEFRLFEIRLLSPSLPALLVPGVFRLADRGREGGWT